LLLMTLLDEAGGDDPAVVRGLAARYLAFVQYAFDGPSGRFRNFSPTGGSGSNQRDPKTVTAAPCGRSAPSSAAPATPTGRISPPTCSAGRCPR
jgi:hypothetical protein